MVSYPSSLWVPAHITSGVTVAEQSLLDDLNDEIDAIATELGINIHGSAGSLRERLDMFIDRSGNLPYIKLHDLASSGARRRCRAGVVVVDVDSLNIQNHSAKGTVTFSPPLDATKNDVWAFLQLQTLDEDQSDQSTARFVNFIHRSGTSTSFQYRVANSLGGPPLAGTSFILHWLAVERTSSSAVTLP